MLTLTLFRHAKSSWDHPALQDFDRPLTPRGEAAAPLMGAFLANRGLVPDLILCSTAQRTRQTLDLALSALKARPKIKYDEALYLAAVPRLLAILRKAPAKAGHVMIVGHNPGLQEFALKLIGGGDPSERRAIARKFPTAAIAVINFEAEHWKDVAPGSGQLAFFATPRRLARNS